MNGQYTSSYAQYMFNGLLLNPAYAGSNEALNITTLYRNQWLGLPGAPVTAALSAHSPLKNKKMNIGGTLINDRYAVFEHIKANLSYAYRLRFLSGNLSLGLQGGINSYSTNWNKINTSDASDPNFIANGTRKTVPEIGAGAYYYNKNFYLGISAPNIYNGKLNPDMVSFFNAGCALKISDNVFVKPAVLVKYIITAPVSANISTTFYYKEIIGFGVGYTYNTSTLAYTDVRLNDQLHVGYAFEYGLNALQKYNSGSHEIMLRYLFRYKVNTVNSRYF